MVRLVADLVPGPFLREEGKRTPNRVASPSSVNSSVSASVLTTQGPSVTFRSSCLAPMAACWGGAAGQPQERRVPEGTTGLDFPSAAPGPVPLIFRQPLPLPLLTRT